MTAPAAPDNIVSLDDYEADQATPAPKPEEAKIESEGKSVAELIAERNRFQQALQLSEAERLKALQQPAAPAPAAPAAPEPTYEPLTKEKIQALYEQDPLMAFEAMQNDALIRADQHFERRFGGLENSLAGTQEGWARSEFADEFAVLGDEINKVLGQIPDKRVLADKANWKDLISYVRGQPGNFEKLWEHKSTKASRTPDQARAEQAADVGFSPRPTARTESPVAPAGQLDATSRRVMEVLGTFKDEAEYLKWARMGEMK